MTVPVTSLLNQTVVYKKMLALLAAFKFEEFLEISQYYNILPTVVDVDQIIRNLVEQKTSGDDASFSRWFELRIKALKRFRDNGCDPEKIIEEIILPEGYDGKILLVMIMRDTLGRMVCLRSGDMWHREILRNTESEIKNLGFLKSAVYELGGAHVRFEKDNDIVISGTSDDYGSCDKVYATKLIRQIFADRNVIILT